MHIVLIQCRVSCVSYITTRRIASSNDTFCTTEETRCKQLHEYIDANYTCI